MSPSALVFENLPPAAILFDWDNTLVDTWATIIDAMNQTLIAFGHDPWTEEQARVNIQHSGREAFPKLFGSQACEAQNTFYQYIEAYHLQRLNPLPEAESLLQVLRHQGILMGVVSNKKSQLLRKEVDHLGWSAYFSVVIGAGDAVRDKPAADPLLLALESLNIPASLQVWMVGDAPVDWDCALAAGCRPLAMGNRFDPPSYALTSFENCGAFKKIFTQM